MKREDILRGDLPIVLVKLLELRKHIVKTGNHEFKINSLSFLGHDFMRAKNVPRLEVADYNQCIRYLKVINYPHSSKNLRWNIEINGKRVQIRSLSDNTRALINHTNRAKFCTICQRAGVDIKELDDIVDRYWELRTLGIISEDVSMDDENCPFRNHRKELEKLFTWIAFNSVTDVKDITNGDNGCEYILDYRDPEDTTTWNIFGKKDYIKVIYDHLVFSLRDNKGMPKGYTPYSDEFDPKIKPWVRLRNNRFKGALHIRIKGMSTADSTVKYYINKYKEEITKIKSNNNGERDEILIKIYLIRCRMYHQAINLNGEMTLISVLGNTPSESYHDFSEEVMQETRWDNIGSNPSILLALCQNANVTKAPSNYKADVFINGIGISIKSMRTVPPSIINTTSRIGMMNAITTLNDIYRKALKINPLDSMVKDYWNKRLANIINEDVKTSDQNCPFISFLSEEKSKEYLKPIINYFCFDGTGQGLSPYKAELILVCTDPQDSSTWAYYDKDTYCEYIWEKLIFSIRSQRSGNALALPNNLPWVHHLMIDGKDKVYGLLNLRVGK